MNQRCSTWYLYLYLRVRYLPHGGKYLTLKYKYKYQVLHLWFIAPQRVINLTYRPVIA